MKDVTAQGSLSKSILPLTSNKTGNVLADTFGGEKRWVNWRYEVKDGKSTKVPYQINGNKASTTDSSHWSTFEEVSAASEHIGIVFTSDRNLLGIDIDHCLVDGAIQHESGDAIKALVSAANTYTEISPSGEGLHLLVMLTGPLTLEANRKPPFECYTQGRYFTLTNRPFGEAKQVRLVTPEKAIELLTLIGYPWKKTESSETSHVSSINDNLPLSLSDEALLERMFNAKNGAAMRALYDGNTDEYDNDESRADMALCSTLAFWSGKNAIQMENIWLASKLGARNKTQTRKDYRDRTIASAITNCKDVYTPLQSKKEEPVVAITTPRLWSMNEILSHDFGDVEWVVESLIPKHGMTVISGNPGEFKTWLTILMAICITHNTAVFGKFKTSQGSVLIVDEEDHMRLVQERLRLLGARSEDTIYYLSQSGFKVDSDEARKALIQLVREKEIKLVIFDSLVRIHQQDENDAKGMSKVFLCASEIVKAGASILLTHHHRKQVGFGPSNVGQSMRGSSDILASVDCHITVEKKRDEDRLIIRQSKLRQDVALKPFELCIIRSGTAPTGFEYAGEFDDKKMKVEEAVEAVVVILADGPKSRTDLIEILSEEDFGKTTVENAIKLAVEKAKIVRVPREDLTKEEQKKAYYRIAEGGDTAINEGLSPDVSADEEDILLQQSGIPEKTLPLEDGEPKAEAVEDGESSDDWF